LNNHGWRPASGIAAFKTFIRPTLEYGLALGKPDAETLRKLQVVQNMGLKAIFSAYRSCSTKALHRLTKIEPLAYRQEELQARYYAKLCNHSAPRKVPAAYIFQNLMFADRPRNSAITQLRLSKIWRVVPHRTVLSRPDEVFPPLDPVIRSLKRHDAICALDGNVGSEISVNEMLDPDTLIYHSRKLDRQEVIKITRWRLGLITRHQECHRCGEVLTRKHAIECSGVTQAIRDAHAIASIPRSRQDAPLPQALRRLLRPRREKFARWKLPAPLDDAAKPNILDQLWGQIDGLCLRPALWKEIARIIGVILDTTVPPRPGEGPTANTPQKCSSIEPDFSPWNAQVALAMPLPRSHPCNTLKFEAIGPVTTRFVF
jgi:hypothetical protein